MRFSRAFSQWHSMIKAWHRSRQTAKTLQGLSERELDDLGIGRWQIDRFTRKHTQYSSQFFKCDWPFA